MKYRIFQNLLIQLSSNCSNTQGNYQVNNKAFLKDLEVIQDILQIEYITNDNDGDGEVLKVQKGTSTEKKRSSNRKQDRKYREMTTEFSNEIDGYDD
jgi:hypothetical protein